MSGHGAAAEVQTTRAAPSLKLSSGFSQSGDLTYFLGASQGASCLLPLLGAIGWRGDLRDIAEALPHLSDSLDLDGLRQVLANLDYTTIPVRMDLRHLDQRLLPCLFVGKNGRMRVLKRRNGDSVQAFDAETNQPVMLACKGRGMVYLVKPTGDGDGSGALSGRKASWFATAAKRMRGLVWQMFGISFTCNLLTLAVPLFIMAVYDWVIPSQSSLTLLHLVVGVVFALSIDIGLRAVRARLLAHIGGRIDLLLGTATFRQILNLPITMTENSPLGRQMARIRQFQMVRDFFTSPLAGVFLDLPFVVLFVGVLAVIAGPLVIIPLVLIGLFLACGFLVGPTMWSRAQAFAEARAKRQAFLIEMLMNMRTIKTCSAEGVWSERHRELSGDAAMANLAVATVSASAQELAQFLVSLAGAATLLIGAALLLDGAMSVGALVASMTLTWRVLSPLQLGFLSLMRLQQLNLSIRQIDVLMGLKPESGPGHVVNRHRTFRGAITFDQASLRHSPQAEPSLLGARFHIPPGELVVITGGNGSGKSTILTLIAGLYHPQAGSVLIDGIDIRQLSVREVRRNIAHVPQNASLFYGTVEQNLRLANPTASDLDLIQAARDADLLDEITLLPEGLETRLTERLQQQLSAGFQQRLMLARAYLKRAAIVLLDEPANHLDESGHAALQRQIERLRGRSTVIMVTHDERYSRIADRVLQLANGRVVYDGLPRPYPPTAVIRS